MAAAASARDRIVNELRRERNTQDTFTRDELDAALQANGYSSFVTNRLVNHILEQRECFTEGDIVASFGDDLAYVKCGGGGWTNFRRTKYYPYDHPVRPLTKIGKTT